MVHIRPLVFFDMAKIAFFFGRAIIDHFWSSTAPVLRFLVVSRVFGAHQPVHFGDLELTGTKKTASLRARPPVHFGDYKLTGTNKKVRMLSLTMSF